MSAHTVSIPDPARLPQELDAAVRALTGRAGAGEWLFGLDVDGTLVDHDGVMSPAMHDALQRAAAEHRVVIATGRSIGATLPVVELAGIRRGFAVCSNGAVTVELDPSAPGGHRIVDTRPFDPHEALRALQRVEPGARFAVETADGGFYSTDGFQDASFGTTAQEAPFEDLLALTAVRVVVHVPDLSPGEFSRVVASAGVHGVEYAIGWTAWLDMAAPGVSKASALEVVRQRLGVDATRTVAIGDGFNDTEMLQWAALGVAMGQAPDGVKEVADAVTAPVEADGAVRVIEALLA
ncbi:HAD family phosphatase [Brachybacterium sp. EF45031]|uniref:HAD family hydrolase n=1 Tax=Brachybacterium sillae TaxID=2810536 RepID=UPI00217CEE20|nr:HAD family hydrolase [Brachybacterium sillae]MCS6712048.1 HAD family phosphatase [Brachybacterium sillae]